MIITLGNLKHRFGNVVNVLDMTTGPGGSHYDLVYPHLFDAYEATGILKPGGRVLETSSGSAGVSFAVEGTKRGYQCIVAIPEGTENAREKAITDAGAELHKTPKERYVNGLPYFAMKFCLKNPDVVFLNHSMGPEGRENKVTTRALEKIAYRIFDDYSYPDYVIFAVGNGSSILGPARVLKRPRWRLARNPHDVKIVAVESIQSCVMREKVDPGWSQRILGIPPGSLPRHRLYGTSFRGIDFPHNRIAHAEGLIGLSYVVSDAEIDANYRAMTGREIPANIPRWDSIDCDVCFGRSTLAGLAVALDIAKKVRRKHIYVVAYDKADRYDK